MRNSRTEIVKDNFRTGIVKDNSRTGIVKDNSRTDEVSRQMEEIWREHHDPDTQIRRIAKFKKEKRLNDYKYDLGL